jgi:ferredoxin, 2Fe-2S
MSEVTVSPERDQTSEPQTEVTFLPANITCKAEVGQSILDVALANDIPLDHACGGVCACSTCHVIVKQGMSHLSEMEDDEADQLDEAAGLTLSSRLGCQSKIIKEGNVQVEIPQWNRNYVRERE